MSNLNRWVWSLLPCALLAAAVAAGQEAPARLAGEVKERIDASVYTYLRVAAPGGEVWAAVPTTGVKVGEKVTLDVQSVMPNFESKTLHRTFEKLAFATLVTDGAPAANNPPRPLPGAELLIPRSSKHPSAPTAGPAPTQMPAMLEGEVLEVLDVPSYTYLRLKTSDGEQWAAVTSAPAKVGARVRVANPMVMQNFESKVLKRHFDRIIFGTLGQ